MKLSNLGTVVVLLVVLLSGLAAYDYFARRGVSLENCGVQITPTDPQVAIPAFTRGNRVPMKVVNRSGRPVRIVGNNAC